MADVLEKKLGDLVRDLESQRDQLRRDLDKVNAQLELISSLVRGTPVKKTTQSSPASKKVAQKPKNKRGRPKGKKSAKHSSATSAAKRNTRSAHERTLKDELFSIAKSNGGVLVVRDASKSLVKMGRYDTPQQAAANIYAAIKYYKGSFVRDTSKRGNYKVKG